MTGCSLVVGTEVSERHTVYCVRLLTTLCHNPEAVSFYSQEMRTATLVCWVHHDAGPTTFAVYRFTAPQKQDGRDQQQNHHHARGHQRQHQACTNQYVMYQHNGVTLTT